MNMDKYIKVLLLKLSEKYDISLIEITVVKDNRIKKVFNVNYKMHNEDQQKETFYNKRELLRWLLCLE